MITVIPVDNGSGTFNLIGTENGMFVLQGNLTKDQLLELQAAIANAIPATNPIPNNLSTNANVLKVGTPITQGQINALAVLEDEYVEHRGHVTDYDKVEALLHEFMCVAMEECVCTTPREV